MKVSHWASTSVLVEVSLGAMHLMVHARLKKLCLAVVGLQAASSDVVQPLPCSFFAAVASLAVIIAAFPALPSLGLEGNVPCCCCCCCWRNG